MVTDGFVSHPHTLATGDFPNGYSHLETSLGNGPTHLSMVRELDLTQFAPASTEDPEELGGRARRGG